MNDITFLYRVYGGVFFNNSSSSVKIDNIKFMVPFDKELTIESNSLEPRNYEDFISAKSWLLWKSIYIFQKKNKIKQMKVCVKYYQYTG